VVATRLLGARQVHEQTRADYHTPRIRLGVVGRWEVESWGTRRS
jgi:hypothetical protein